MGDREGGWQRGGERCDRGVVRRVVERLVERVIERVRVGIKDILRVGFLFESMLGWILKGLGCM